MAKSKMKQVNKLRRYRDRLIEKNTNLEGKLRLLQEIIRMARKSMQQEGGALKAYALLSEQEVIDDAEVVAFTTKNELAKELTLIYRMLVVERNFTQEISKASGQRDYLRVAAISAQHMAEHAAHDKMLNEWSLDHGFTRRLKLKEKEDGYEVA